MSNFRNSVIPAAPSPSPRADRFGSVLQDRRRVIAGALAGLGILQWMAACGGGGGTESAPVAGPPPEPAPPPPAPTPLAPPPAPAPPPPPPPAPTGNIVQYLTSDGGAASDTGNLSSPTRDFWHKRLNFAWARSYVGGALAGRGNWRDAAEVPEGSSPYASTGAATTVGQMLSATVTSLVQRWMTNGANRGFYLNTRAGSSVWPMDLFGRRAVNAADRPTLTLVTSTGTFTLTAVANATWNATTFRGVGSAAGFRLAADQQPAVLRFDLSTVTGALTSATLTFKVSAFDSGHTGQIVDVFECDPPTIIVPENVPVPVLGLANAYADFNAMKNSGNPALVAADDFELGGPFDLGFTPAATRTLNPSTGTTYARGEITAGRLESANSRLEASHGTGPRGTPDVVREELYGQYWLYLENDFGTTADDAIKIPAMGVQFGSWNPVGYWQQTTGNGGYPGTGLKVDPGAGANFQYEGHSTRLISGVSPTALDDDPYIGWFSMNVYPYNLDQIGPFPAIEPFPMIAIRKEHWYCVDIRVKQNTVTGSQDALGNYAAANADGVYQVWINGYPAYSRTNFRWRRHLEFGVQGMWIDVYHGGVTPAPSTMHYRVDRVSLANNYIGPKL